MSNNELYDGRAYNYETGRPSYAKNLIDSMYNDFGITRASVIADIGSGTGKFSRLLLERGSKVLCVEPNQDMRTIAEQELLKYRNFYSICGHAEKTTLQENSVDYITSAQAFHWFDTVKFRQECQRIIKRDGKAFLIWNVEDYNNVINQELDTIFKKYCPDIKDSKGRAKLDKKIKAFFARQFEYMSFDYPLIFDQESFISKCLSSSYSLKESDKRYPEYIDDLHTGGFSAERSLP